MFTSVFDHYKSKLPQPKGLFVHSMLVNIIGVGRWWVFNS